MLVPSCVVRVRNKRRGSPAPGNSILMAHLCDTSCAEPGERSPGLHNPQLSVRAEGPAESSNSRTNLLLGHPAGPEAPLPSSPQAWAQLTFLKGLCSFLFIKKQYLQLINKQTKKHLEHVEPKKIQTTIICYVDWSCQTFEKVLPGHARCACGFLRVCYPPPERRGFVKES